MFTKVYWVLLVGCKLVPRKSMVSLGPSSFYHVQIQEDYRFGVHIPDYRSVKQIQICYLNIFGYDRARMDQDVP